jgi:hypothetical protein
MVSTFLKVYMELRSYFSFLQEQIKDIIIIESRVNLVTSHTLFEGSDCCRQYA